MSQRAEGDYGEFSSEFVPFLAQIPGTGSRHSYRSLSCSQAAPTLEQIAGTCYIITSLKFMYVSW